MQSRRRAIILKRTGTQAVSLTGRHGRVEGTRLSSALCCSPTKVCVHTFRLGAAHARSCIKPAPQWMRLPSLQRVAIHNLLCVDRGINCSQNWSLLEVVTGGAVWFSVVVWLLSSATESRRRLLAFVGNAFFLLFFFVPLVFSCELPEEQFVP